MSHELKEGVQLQCITGIPVADPQYSTLYFFVGPAGCKEIVIVEQAGQMAMVPWAKVTDHKGTVTMVNLANVESVTLLEPQP